MVSITDRYADVLVVERGGRTHACALSDAPTVRKMPRTASAPIVITATDAVGCDGAPVAAAWRRQTSQRCADTSCVMLAVFRVDADGSTSRLTLRKLPVRTAGGTVAMLTDTTVVASSGRGWIRVTAD